MVHNRNVQLARYTGMGTAGAMISRGLGPAIMRGGRRITRAVYNNRAYLSAGSNRRRIAPSGYSTPGHSRNDSGIARTPRRRRRVDLTRGDGARYGVHDLANSRFAVKKTTAMSKIIQAALPQYYNNTTESIPLGSQGKQYYYQFPTAMMDTAMNTTLNQAGATTAVAETRFYLEYVNQITEINNFSDAVNEVFIYDIVAKDNCGLGYEPINTITAGYNAKYNSTTVYLQPWLLPTESTVFNKYWKIEKQEKVTIKPGENHKHSKFIQYNRFIDSQTFSAGAVGASGVAPLYAKGLTRFTIVRAIGSVAPFATYDHATLTPVKHAIVAQTSVKFRTPQGISTNQYKGVTNGTLDTSTALKIMIPEVGTAVNQS